jgi:hypothetical protein
MLLKKLSKLTVIKIIHTIIWFFFNAVFFYMVYAVIINKIDKYVWMGITLFSLEIIVLIIFKMNCPLTIIARRYSNSTKDNFDIYLPNWLARNNKVIYSAFLFAFICLLVYRLSNR